MLNPWRIGQEYNRNSIQLSVVMKTPNLPKITLDIIRYLSIFVKSCRLQDFDIIRYLYRLLTGFVGILNLSYWLSACYKIVHRKIARYQHISYHGNHDTVRIFRPFAAEGLVAGESLQGEGVLGRHEQEQDSPAGHTAIYWCRGRSPMLWMDWQYTQEAYWRKTCTATLSSPQEQPLDSTEHGPMQGSGRPWSHDTGWKACLWERVWMGISGISPYSRAEKTNDGRSPWAKTGIIWKNVPGKINLYFRGQTGDKIEMQILTKPYITIS